MYVIITTIFIILIVLFWDTLQILLKTFKDEESCSEAMPKITKALLVALGRHLAGNITGTGESTLATRGAGNLFGQAIMQSNVGESLSVNFCKMIH